MDMWAAAVHAYAVVLGDPLSVEALERALDFARVATGSERSALLVEQLRSQLKVALAGAGQDTDTCRLQAWIEEVESWLGWFDQPGVAGCSPCAS